MGMATEMRDLTQEIQASHEARTEWVRNLRRNTAELLKGFQRELHEMATARRREFQAMMQGIQARQRNRNREVADFLNGFRRELEEMAGHWRNLTATMERKRAGQR
ncbi:MAG: hypothetical protein ACK4Z6_03950 [Candidatus Methylomirabilales bacterium]